ncbi:hypothetical protein J2129_000798 [Methanofollis sp. W23]|nr:hypothetical protein [Methanofollis sp. W23]MBP2145344.1 hypothetical protein [Methanofollis sp. W23]
MSVVASVRGVRDLNDLPEGLRAIFEQSTGGMTPDRVSPPGGGEQM